MSLILILKPQGAKREDMKKQKLNRLLGSSAVACLCLALLLVLALSGRLVAASDGSISGVVTDDAGKPLRGASVIVNIDNMSVARYTDAMGRYQITGLKPGKYKIAATAWGYGSKTAEKDISGSTTDVTFSLKPNWNPLQISTAEYISAFGDEKEMRHVEATCTGCHNFSWIMRRRGQTAAEWEDFIPRMSPGDLFVTPATYMTPQQLKEISISLEKVFGPDSPLPTKDKVHHVEISDEALNATFRYFTPPTRNYAHSVSVGADGKPWFTEFDNIANKVATFDLSTQQFHEYEIPTAKAMPHNPWVARNGQVWVTEAMANKLAVIDPETGKVTEFSAPVGAGTHTLREDSAGDIWASGSKKSLRFDPRTQKFDTYDIAGYDLAVDSHNNGWSTNGPKGTIDRVDPKTGLIKRYPVPGATFMRGIEVDAQDNVWFGDVLGHRLGKLDPKTGEMTFYHPPTPNFSPYGIIVEKKTGRLWLADYLGANVTRFDPATGKFTEFPFPSRMQMIRFFAEDPQGRVWFTDFTNGKIGVLETGESAMSSQR